MLFSNKQYVYYYNKIDGSINNSLYINTTKPSEGLLKFKNVSLGVAYKLAFFEMQ